VRKYIFTLFVIFNFSFFSASAGNPEYESHIRRLTYIGLIQGDESGGLQLDKTLTRAEAAVIFAKLSGYTDNEKEIQEVFTDVPIGHWANPYVRYAKRNKIIQ
jgi:internalin A